MKRTRLGWRIILAMSVIDAFIAIPIAPSSPVTATHVPEPPGCQDQIVWTDHTPQYTADGATMAWRARTLFAPDWALGGFSAQVMWVGTNNQDSGTRWVEAGITHGWNFSNLFRFYTAHGDNTVFPEIYDEALFPGAPAPVVGSAYGFKGFALYSGPPWYGVELAAGGSTYNYIWAGHSPNTVNYSGGFEARIGGCAARVDATYVYRNRLRRKSDQVYLDINNGSLTDASYQGTIGWCAQPVTFRYWMHSQISGNVCP